MPDLSVIIPHAGAYRSLHLCLTALASCSDVGRAEVLVAGNDSQPINAAFRATHPNVHFLHEPKPGAARARNLAASQARGDILFFIDSDCIPSQDALTLALKEAPRYDILGGAVVTSTENCCSLSPAEAFETVFAFDQNRYIAKKGFSVTACLVTHSHVFHRVGGFRTKISEDYEWCHRARELGYAISYVPQIQVSHPCRTTWPELRSKWQRLTAETYALRETSRAAWFAKACLMPLSIMAHTPRILWARDLPCWRDKVAAFGMLVRLRLWRMMQMLRLGFQSRA